MRIGRMMERVSQSVFPLEEKSGEVGSLPDWALLRLAYPIFWWIALEVIALSFPRVTQAAVPTTTPRQRQR